MAQPARAKIKKSKPAVDPVVIPVDSSGKIPLTNVANLEDCEFSVTYPADKNICEIKCTVKFRKGTKEDDYTVSLSS